MDAEWILCAEGLEQSPIDLANAAGIELAEVVIGAYHYSGSLTTTRCSEGVKWYIRRTPTQFSKDQIAAFTAVYNHNNRPVQALNERTLYLDQKPQGNHPLRYKVSEE